MDVTLTPPTISVTAAQVGWLALVVLGLGGAGALVAVIFCCRRASCDKGMRGVYISPLESVGVEGDKIDLLSILAKRGASCDQSQRRWWRLVAPLLWVSVLLGATACIMAIFNGGWQ